MCDVVKIEYEMWNRPFSSRAMLQISVRDIPILAV